MLHSVQFEYAKRQRAYNLAMVLDDTFDFHTCHLAAWLSTVFFDLSHGSRQYDVGHAYSFGQSRFFAVSLSSIETPEVSTHVVRARPVDDDVTIVDVTGVRRQHSGQQPDANDDW